jgi:aconitase A
VTGGRDVVAGERVLVVRVAGDPDVPGGFPPPPPLVVASAIATTATIPTTATSAATNTHVRRDSSLSSRAEAASTRAPQWGQNVAPGVSASPHARQWSVA